MQRRRNGLWHLPCLYASVVLLSSCRQIQGNNHWIVTEEGLIEAVPGSPFAMAAPHDLLQFLNQETLKTKMSVFREELLERMRIINERRSADDPDIESKIIECDPDCDVIALFAQIPGTFPTSIVSLHEMGFTQNDIKSLVQLGQGGVRRTPRCDRYMSLPVSVAALDHLESVRIPSLIASLPELPIAEMTFSEWSSPADFGASIANKLKRSPQSWLMYTLASYYWRWVGNSSEAVQCLRRALHLIPREYIVLPLLSLLNVLGNGNRMSDAAKVADIALAFNDTLPSLAITASYVYASTSQYRKALAILQKVISTLPPNEALRGFAETYVRAIRCHEKLEAVLQEQHVNLKTLMEEVESYKTILEQGRALLYNLRHVTDLDTRLESQILYNYVTLGPNIPGLDCTTSLDSSSKPNLHCVVTSQAYFAFMEDADKKKPVCKETDNSALFVDEVEEEGEEDEQEELDNAVLSDVADEVTLRLLEPPGLHESEAVSEQSVEALSDNAFSNRWINCLSIPEFPPQTFISPGNKGVRTRDYWKMYSKLRTDEPTSLPKQQPLCNALVQKQQIGCEDDRVWRLLNSVDAGKIGLRETELREHLWHLLGPLTNAVEEFGHFVSTMTEYRLGPPWLMYNLAALYWRLFGRPVEAVSCLCLALQDKEGEIYKDIALNQAGVLAFNAGQVDEAIALTRAALEVDDSEPETHYLLGYLLAKTGNYTTSIDHLRNSLELEPRNRGDVSRLLKSVQMVNLKMSDWLHPEEDDAEEEEACSVNSDGLDGYLTLYGDTDVENDYQPALSLLDGTYVPNSSERQRWTELTKDRSVPFAWNAKLETSSDAQAETEGFLRSDSRYVGRPGDNPMPVVLPELRHSMYSRMPMIVDVKHAAVECASRLQHMDMATPVTIWLSTEAKGINISEHINFDSPPPLQLEEPVCPVDFALNLWTMDHLAGYSKRGMETELKPEAGLVEALVRLNPNRLESVETIGSRLAEAIKLSKGKEHSAWMPTLIASLYWRIHGNTSMAIDCLRHSIAYAPVGVKDIGLISLANIYERNGWLRSALIVGGVTLRLSPKLVIVHFALANIYAALGDVERALKFYSSTMSLQSNFEPAKDRALALFCARSGRNTWTN
uniref:Tetratricopeptide repeat protein 17 n=1 Tax=Trichuris muris TaxID=70415 RepID=A0A5S6R189_TRIMR